MNLNQAAILILSPKKAQNWEKQEISQSTKGKLIARKREENNCANVEEKWKSLVLWVLVSTSGRRRSGKRGSFESKIYKLWGATPSPIRPPCTFYVCNIKWAPGTHVTFIYSRKTLHTLWLSKCLNLSGECHTALYKVADFHLWWSSICSLSLFLDFHLHTSQFRFLYVTALKCAKGLLSKSHRRERERETNGWLGSSFTVQKSSIKNLGEFLTPSSSSFLTFTVA